MKEATAVNGVRKRKTRWGADVTVAQPPAAGEGAGPPAGGAEGEAKRPKLNAKPDSIQALPQVNASTIEAQRQGNGAAAEIQTGPADMQQGNGPDQRPR